MSGTDGALARSVPVGGSVCRCAHNLVLVWACGFRTLASPATWLRFHFSVRWPIRADWH